MHNGYGFHYGPCNKGPGKIGLIVLGIIIIIIGKNARKVERTANQIGNDILTGLEWTGGILAAIIVIAVAIRVFVYYERRDVKPVSLVNIRNVRELEEERTAPNIGSTEEIPAITGKPVTWEDYIRSRKAVDNGR